MVQCLLEQVADKDKAATDVATPLHVASHSGHMAVVHCLLKHEADKENEGLTPLFMAAQNGHWEVVQYLVEDAGVDVNKATNVATGRRTPLHVAVTNGDIDVAVCLMERGMADLNARTTDSQRPMDLAPNDEMRQVITNEEKRRRDHGFKRSVIPPNPTTTIAEQESNENEVGQAEANAVTNAEESEQEEDEEDDSGSDSSSDEEEDN